MAKTSEERFLNTIQVGQGVQKDIVDCKFEYNYSSSQGVWHSTISIVGMEKVGDEGLWPPDSEEHRGAFNPGLIQEGCKNGTDVNKGYYQPERTSRRD